ncbi:phosphotransferase [Actinomadura rayongensis]|uniref:Phosphotransferase n=1 Tax=Actinomadura rayongensis TaxID=1429076 RepID=A0A6I4WHF0_9ACTN|nr:phosphotransferase [Actinomadura rayongensis]MXQ67735.1 phosphotransferase [Actinomadura rayongensis]
MMRRSDDWTSLPAEARDAVQESIGKVVRAAPVLAGAHCDIAEILTTTEHGRVFLKGVRLDRREADWWQLRREAMIGPHVGGRLAPRLLAQAEAGGWTLLAFEYVTGRHASFAPDSPDLDHLAAVVRQLQHTDVPDGLFRPVEGRWTAFMPDPSPLAGDRLLHADLNEGNVLISGGRPYVVDWGMATYGAAWVELAVLIPWLIRSGHTPASAEAWAGQFPHWHDPDNDHVTGFADATVAKWLHLLQQGHTEWKRELLDAARWWTAWRKGT